MSQPAIQTPPTPDSAYDVRESDALYARAKAVVPGGIHGHFGSAVRASGPKFFASSAGSRLVDVDGNEYIDYMCGYGPMILGYNHPAVDAAVVRQQRLGHAVSLASPMLVELAEYMVEKIDAADWALFGKNGTDATGLAAMVARAATGRDLIVRVEGSYHGVAPWMQAGRPGTTGEDGANVLSARWNDVQGFDELVAEHGDRIAGFMASPYHHPVLADNEMPADGYWAHIEAVCRAKGIVLIVDDVRTGFRLNLAGSNVAFGFTPDLICFGKAIANGHPLSALVGSDALKQAASDVFYTGTQFHSGAPMAAALATMRELEQMDAAERLRAAGKKLNAGLAQAAQDNGFALVASGAPAMPYYRLANVDRETHFAWIDECVQRGVFLLGYHNHFLSLAHTEADLAQTWEAADAAFKATSRRASPN